MGVFADLSWMQWSILALCSLMVGMAKTGVQGIGTLAVPIVALAFDARLSTGLMLPILVFADIMAISWYRKEARWSYILALLPWTLAGIGMAAWIGNMIPQNAFRGIIGLVVLVGLVVMLWDDHREKLSESNPLWFTALFGVLGGFSSMIGNVAGPVISVFLLSTHLPKKFFVGTAAWLFLCMNLSKLPMQYFVWHTISTSSLWLDVAMLPFILAGAFLGVRFVRNVSEKFYRVFVVLITCVTAISLLW